MARKSKGKFSMPGITGIRGFEGTALKDGRAASSAFQMKSPFPQSEEFKRPGDPYTYRLADDGTPEYKDKNGVWKKATGGQDKILAAAEEQNISVSPVSPENIELEDEIDDGTVDGTDDGTTTDDGSDDLPDKYNIDDGTDDGGDLVINENLEHGLDWSEIEKEEWLANRAAAQAEGQSGVNYGIQELIKAKRRLQDKKAEEKKQQDLEEEKRKQEEEEQWKKETTEETGEDKIETQINKNEEVVVPELTEIAPPEIQSLEENLYQDATKNEMYDLRRPYKDDGTWDPNSNPEHARIQNKINELHGANKRYPTE